MKQIRFGVFETNSSSSHSIAIGREEDFKKFVNGEYVIDMETKRFIEKPAMNESGGYINDNFYGFTKDNIDYDEHITITTPGGEKITAISFEYPC